ncbi:phosphoribosyl-AMP cyclohydrolase [Arthrobacter woluwensis]|uniref:Phosphoribosyl-AMP cyclohydrolase n=2 Tax=Arthrobacter woluwensis TaxID=156980 RepID=A0A1H4PR35_9MICC|nr:phosphoribosyl-AMP cyclohydrolase [Arthrobacter woluwensis]
MTVGVTEKGRGRAAGLAVLDWIAMSEQPIPPLSGASTGPEPATELASDVASRLKRDDHGLVAAVIQQHDTGEVLMLGWMDDEALRRTLTTGRVTFWSRSRQEYWRKGDTSGHVQWVKSVALDCDGDALLVRVDQVGAACHTGTRTCFDGRELPAVVGSRDAGPAAAEELTADDTTTEGAR